MRTEALLIATVLLMASAAPLHAESKTWFSLNAGTAIPQGPFKDRGQNGISIEGDIHHMLWPMLGFGGSIAYADFQATGDINSAVEGAYGPGSTLVFTNWTYSGYAIVALPVGPVTTYARGGGGIVNPKLQVRSPAFGIVDETRKEYGYLAGGGINLKLTPQLGLGVEGTWYGYEDGWWDFNMSWVNARVSVMYRFPGLNDALSGF